MQARNSSTWKCSPVNGSSGPTVTGSDGSKRLVKLEMLTQLITAG
jgi:hypothetical protein